MEVETFTPTTWETFSTLPVPAKLVMIVTLYGYPNSDFYFISCYSKKSNDSEFYFADQRRVNRSIDNTDFKELRNISQNDKT